jgi:hypothetical protein
MKRVMLMFVLVLLSSGFAEAQAAKGGTAKGGTMYVVVKTAALKSSTGFFASTKATLIYGDRVTILQISGKSAEVRSVADASITGWTPMANLSVKQVVSGNTNTASSREVALAGKGFNQEVENSYRSKGKTNYADVDMVEAISINETSLKRFLEDGRLATGD